MKAPNERSIQSLERSFDILDALSQAPSRGLSLKEICTVTGLHASTAHHLMATMVKRGYVVQNPDSRRYRLGPALLRLRSVVSKDLDLREIGLACANELCTRTGESVYLTAFRDFHSVVIIDLPSPQPVRVVRPNGPKPDLHATASGKCLLAHESDEVVENYVSKGPFKAFTPNTITSLDHIREELARIKEEGIAFDREEHVLGVSCIAAPVLNDSGTCVAALSISYPTFRGNPALLDKWTTDVRECALRLSHRLGYTTKLVPALTPTRSAKQNGKHL